MFPEGTLVYCLVYTKMTKLKHRIGNVQVQLDESDVQDEAVKFIKEKLAKRKVYINKHHATFRNSSLKVCTVQEAKKETAAEKQAVIDNRTTAAVHFLKQVGVVPKKADVETVSSVAGRSLTCSSTSSKHAVNRNKTQFKH